MDETAGTLQNGGMMMKKQWLVFFYAGKELLRYSLAGTFPGERENTIQLLAAKHDVPASAIYYAIVTA
jgi:hypothetical protein